MPVHIFMNLSPDLGQKATAFIATVKFNQEYRYLFLCLEEKFYNQGAQEEFNYIMN